MIIGINWKAVWKPVWKPVWKQAAPTPATGKGSSVSAQWAEWERRLKQSEEDVLLLLGTMCERGYFES